MKKIIILSSLVIFLILPAIALGQDDTGLTPDSSFYFLKSWKEKVQTFFIFGAENKAKQFLHLADVRLAEYQKMIEKGKTEIAEKTLEKYQNQLDRALNKVQEIKDKVKDVKELSEKAEQATSRHLEVLQENLQKVPEQARKGLENAIENSSKNIEKVLGKKKDTCREGDVTCPEQKDETADWKTYNETDFGFSFQYPGTWTVDDNLTSNTCCLNILNYDPLKKQSEWQEKGEIKIQIANYKKSASVNLKDFVSSQTYMASDKKATSVEDVNIAGINGIKSNLQGDGIYYLPQSSTGGVSITIFNHLENKDTFKETINQLLSTFKFIKDETVRKEPYIKIISPKKGDIWKVGETHDIVWDSFGIDKVNIYSGNANGAFSMSALDIAVNIPASLGKHSWTINKYDSWRDATKIEISPIPLIVSPAVITITVNP